jgi:hypothetical protein
LGSFPAKDQSSTTTLMACYRPQVHKLITTNLRKYLPNMQSFVALPTEHEALKEDIFSPQHWVNTENHMCISPSAYGIGEARYLAGGSYIIAGVLMEKFPGKTLLEKNERLMTDAGLKVFLEKVTRPNYVMLGLGMLILFLAISSSKPVSLVTIIINLGGLHWQVNTKGEGFWLQHEAAGSCLLIPPGYMLAVSGNYAKDEDGSNGLRWGLLDAGSGTQLGICDKVVAGIIEAYPSCRQGDYPVWLQCLRQHLSPVVAASSSC